VVVNLEQILALEVGLLGDVGGHGVDVLHDAGDLVNILVPLVNDGVH
jgi:hypothetical protein